MRIKPREAHWWPDDAHGLPAERVVSLYESGFVGAWADPEAKEQLQQAIDDAGGWGDAEQACREFGLEEAGAGKLSLLFGVADSVFPGCMPGPAQQRGDCFAAGTIVMGERTRAIENVQIGDRVWTGEGKLSTVISKRAIQATRPLVKIYPVGSLPITCTEDHLFLAYNLPRVAGKRVNAAYYERSKNGSRACENLVVEAYERRKPEWIRAGDLTDSDCLLTPTSFARTPVPEDSPPDIVSCVDGMFLLGMFAGNGHASGHTVEIVSPHAEVIGRIVAAFERLGWKPRVDAQRGCQRVRVGSVELVRWLRSQFYDEASVKVFPAWAIGVKEFVAGLCSADGFQNGDTHYLDSTSLSIVYGAYASLIMLGYEPTISECSRSKGTYANAKPLYRVVWRDAKQKQYVWRDDSFVCRPIRKTERIEGPATVYDIGVRDSHHSFIANGVAAHNCVSHGTKNAALMTLAVEIFTGLPDEVTGRVEGAPEIPTAGIQQGVLSTEYIYWWRGYDGDGWSCPTAAQKVLKHGIMLRKPYADLGIDLTSYSSGLAGKYGSQAPPSNIEAIGKEHLIRTATSCGGKPEAIRDLIASGYGIVHCGGEGWSNQRDENGVSKRSGSWSHAMSYIGYDDRDIIKQKYGEPLVLILNSWGSTWIGGGRTILGTNIQIPQGSFWCRISECRSRDGTAFSGVNGWPRKRLKNLGIADLV